MINGKKHVGIGFATGRTCFQNVLRAYIFHLQETRFLVNHDVQLSLFVAYDPTYNNTKLKDYDNLTPEEKSIFYQSTFMGPDDIESEIRELLERKAITSEEKELCFGSGYAVQRNIILYKALQQHVDYLIFLDDDEYPLAVTESKTSSLWSGQLVLEEHIKYLQFSDFTNGHHCGYLSPVPAVEFDGILDEDTFRMFTDGLSSDVLKWEDICRQIENGGVTYADKEVLIRQKASLVEEKQGARFISGGNLGINLTRPERVLPFYNPPGARGEDSILSTCLHEYNVKSIPVYTFHDGFSFYGSLLKGVLPMSLKKISLYDSGTVMNRFYKACIGWVRYKPLYTYLTQRDDYDEIIRQSKENLAQSIPRICAYFNSSDFARLNAELENYSNSVQEHYDLFQKSKEVWKRIITL